ncbi:hypothetical protein [Streptomyces poonensis]|uniref:Uncharacterized protein n=1 Tax=Streptomyces poonensis TaxID=68255 RepID=A0A918QE23_9ACTN|nr:hypothetical protein [Streptomyces poonensis]GGZ42706.1 hypothetical protein GCM10010365_74250 [Streptomyces poonensis]
MQQLVVVYLPGSGIELLHPALTALGYTPRGTLNSLAEPSTPARPGEVYPLLQAAYGEDEATRLLHDYHHDTRDPAALQEAWGDALLTLWRVWWQRLGQPVTAHTPLDAAVEERLTRLDDTRLISLLPGRNAWYINALDLTRADSGLLRHWHATGHPAVVHLERNPGDRITSLIQRLCRQDGRVGTISTHLVYRDILTSLPTMDARLTHALSDPYFPGNTAARHTAWLRHHPAVTTLTCEELAGPDYGGTTQARQAALSRLTAALGHPHPTPAALPGPPTDRPDLTTGIFHQHAGPHHKHLLDTLHTPAGGHPQP